MNPQSMRPLTTLNPVVENDDDGLGSERGSDKARALVSEIQPDVSGVLRLDVIDVCYSVLVGTTLKSLLSNIFLQVNGGELCAILGPSGAGKSVLLDVISNRAKTGVYSGNIFVNQLERPLWFDKKIAYVLQDDAMIATLTVQETMRFAAWTRLSDDVPWVERDERIASLLEMVGLSHVKETVVGNANIKGISGGQRKRLALALEIVNFPSLLFLDEPTSGLDSAIAFEVIAAVRKIVDKSRLCLTTIHQPSPDVFKLFDRAILVSAGRIVYSGPSGRVMQHFESIGFVRVHQAENPAEFLLKVCGDTRKTPEELQSFFQRSPYFVVPECNQGHLFLPLTKPVVSSLSTQFMMLLTRGWLTFFRDVPTLKAEVSKYIFFGILIGVTFRGDAYNIQPPFLHVASSSSSLHSFPTETLSNYNAILFFMFIFYWYGNIQHIPTIAALDNLYRRELAAGAYSEFPFWAASQITSMPLLVVLHTCLVAIVYPLCGFPQTTVYFFYFWWMFFLISVMSFFMCQAFAAGTGNAQIAFALCPPLFMCFATFSGYPIILTFMPVGWSTWAPYISFLRWAFQGLIINAFASGHGSDGTAVVDFYSFGNLNSLAPFAILLVIIASVSASTYFVMLRARSTLVKVEAEDYELSADPANTLSGAMGGGGHGLSSRLELDNQLLGDPEKAQMSWRGPRGSLVRGSVARGFPARESLHAFAKSFKHADIASAQGTIASLSFRASLFQNSVVGPDVMSSEEPVRYSILGISDFKKASANVKRAEGITVRFEDLNYVVSLPNKNGPGMADKQLLKKLTGTINEGEMVALMGASGAGKSTLLDVLAGRKNTGVVTGTLLFGGNPRSHALSTKTAYVEQTDVHLPMLTVQETLTFSAKFRMKYGTTSTEVGDRVNKIMEMMKLTEVAGRIVGNQLIKGIPGGQKRRLSMGVEIINFPSLIYLDEPTSGLDSASSDEVVAAIKNLSSQNRTVICTIHQPSASAFLSFDVLLLLAYGEIIYFGLVSEAVHFFVFSPFGFTYVAADNPADFVVAVAGEKVEGSKGQKVTSADLINHYASLNKHPKVGLLAGKTADGGPSGGIVYPTPISYQFRVLTHRYYLKFTRSKVVLFTSFFRSLVLAFVFGLAYSDPPSGLEFAAYKNKMSFCFFSMFFAVVVQMQVIPLYFEDRGTFYRERAAAIYHPIPYWVSTWVVYFGFLFVHNMLFCIIAYFIAGFQYVASRFFFYYTAMYFASLGGYFTCLCLAAVCSSAPTAMGIFPPVFFANLLYTGYFQYIPHMQPWLGVWAPYVTFIRWSYQAILVNELTANPMLPYSDDLLSSLQFNRHSAGYCLGIILVFVGGYSSLLIYFLIKMNFEKR